MYTYRIKTEFNYSIMASEFGKDAELNVSAMTTSALIKPGTNVLVNYQPS